MQARLPCFLFAGNPPTAICVSRNNACIRADGKIGLDQACCSDSTFNTPNILDSNAQCDGAVMTCSGTGTGAYCTVSSAASQSRASRAVDCCFTSTYCHLKTLIPLLQCPSIDRCVAYSEPDCKCSVCSAGARSETGVRCCTTITGCGTYSDTDCKCKACIPGELEGLLSCSVQNACLRGRLKARMAPRAWHDMQIWRKPLAWTALPSWAAVLKGHSLPTMQAWMHVAAFASHQAAKWMEALAALTK